MPAVSVIIPNYNRAYILAKAIGNVYRQTFQEFELIIVDDSSLDDTTALVKAYPEVVYIRKPHGGQGSARSFGL